MKFLKNAWYVVAWADELKAGAVISRTLLGEPVALYRGEDGVAAALRDRCPHRFAPLSAGKVTGSDIFCGYHGLGFSSAGKCVSNPHGPLPRATVDTFPLVERHRALWIWMGDKAAADDQKIPDLDFLGDTPATAFSSGNLLSGQADYLLYVDNLIDLSHVDYLHADTLGGGLITSSGQNMVEEDDRIEVVYDMPEGNIAPFFVQLTNGALNEKARSFQTLTWYAPTMIRIYSGAIPEGGEEADAFATDGIHFLTPETENSTHYFFALTRNFQVENQSLTDMITDATVSIFETQDRPMIEKVAARMGSDEFWSLKPALFSVDRAAVRVRRKVEEMVAKEQAHVLAGVDG